MMKMKLYIKMIIEKAMNSHPNVNCKSKSATKSVNKIIRDVENCTKYSFTNSMLLWILYGRDFVEPM